MKQPHPNGQPRSGRSKLPPEIGKDWIGRRAKLFETGDYPDKGLTITADHLAQLANNFQAPVPVLIEHANSPLQLGFLTNVSVEGNDMFGEVKLSPEANALIEQSGAKSLSLGLSPDLQHIREVSLVQRPRIRSARLFHDEGPSFMAELEPIDWQARCEEMERQQRDNQAHATTQDLVRRGKLLPAQAAFAAALLATNDTIEFDGDSVSIARLLMAMIEAQPPHELFTEQAPMTIEPSVPPTMLPEEAAFYQRYFPDIRLDEIANRRPTRS